MNTITTTEQYIAAVKRHPFDYEQRKVGTPEWTEGVRSFAAIMYAHHRLGLDPSYAIWNKYAPKQQQRNPNVPAHGFLKVG